ncbi:hypothetical protein [Streptomyces sp. NPDC057253]|uniref:hypothetical protein n=1 Tax=Streptomyces sp. NPDC057253 TaxID=3346069 RepID=UPI00363870D2
MLTRENLPTPAPQAPPAPKAIVRLPRAAACATVARGLTRIWLGEALGVPGPRLEDAVLVVSEFFALAVLHGTGPETGLHLLVGSGGTARAEVAGYWTSGCPPVPETRPCLRLVDAIIGGLGGQWGFGDNGAVAWCAFPVRGDGRCASAPAAHGPMMP